MLPDALEERSFYLGLDLGQRRDHTGIVVVERSRWQVGERNAVTWGRRREYRLAVRYVERVALDTAYSDVIGHVGHLVRSGELAGNCRVVVDATGVGMPVLEMMKRAHYTCPIDAVLITGGDGITQGRGGVWHVPKEQLVARLQLLLQERRLRIAARMRGVEALVRELEGFAVKVTGAGRARFEAGREGDKDDLVLALAMACWRATWGRGWE